MAAASNSGTTSGESELERMTMLRKLVTIHVEAWKKSLPSDLFATSYPTLHKMAPELVPELFEEFWAKLSDNIQLEFADIQENLHLAERLAELHKEMVESDAMESGSHRTQALAMSPEDEIRNIAAESKAAYVKRLRENFGALHHKNEELESEIKVMQQRAQTINAAVAAKVKIFRDAATACDPLIAAEDALATQVDEPLS